MWTTCKHSLQRITSHIKAFVRDYPVRVTGFVVIGLLFTIVLGQWDQAARSHYAQFYDTPVEDFAHSVRRLGDFIDVVFYCGLLYALGHWRKRRDWRVYAACAFLSACTAGITINILRVCTGRARPHTETTRWIGPTLQYRMQSFPSGHTGTSLGMSSVLLQTVPALGIPAFLGTTMIGWASMTAQKHYPSDVAAAGVIGSLYGIIYAAAARRRLKEPPLPAPRCKRPGNGPYPPAPEEHTKDTPLPNRP